MLFGFLVTLFTLMCFFLILIIFMQKGKGNMGLGAMGGGAQTLFGGGGGQDLFQKITWFLVALYLFGSLGLAVYKTKTMIRGSRIMKQQKQPIIPQPTKTPQPEQVPTPQK